MYCPPYKNFIRHCSCFAGMTFIVTAIAVIIPLENVSYTAKFPGEKLI